MILDISNEAFKRILNDEQLFLPIQWDGEDFYSTLKSLFDHYIKQLKTLSNISTTSGNSKDNHSDNISLNLNNVKKLCDYITQTINYYLNGFPVMAYNEFKSFMDTLIKSSLKKKDCDDIFDQTEYFDYNSVNLFRVVKVDDVKPYSRTRVLHTPYNLRSKVSTSRYSIAGYPSLYLGTSLQLCCEEVKYNPYQGYGLASMFRMKNFEEFAFLDNVHFSTVELSIKPQDFVNSENFKQEPGGHISKKTLESKLYRHNYLIWYPLIAACSFIRANKKDAFAPEYIIPQLLMQWIRCLMDSDYKKGGQYNLFCIRYFSCASKRMSNMGYNYVFPTSGFQISSEMPYCPILTNSFLLTTPVYIHEYDSIHTCEQELITAKDLDFTYF